MKNKMKNNLAIVALGLGLFAVSCAEKKEPEQPVVSTEASADAVRDSLEDIYMETLWEIDRNMAVVQEKHGNILMGPGTPNESEVNVKERIIRNIQTINALMDENRLKLADIQDNIKKYKIENGKLKRLTGDAEDRIKQQDEQMAALKVQLTNKEYDMAGLQTKMNESELRNQMLNELTVKYDKELNTAYYAFGEYKDLKQEGVIETRSGLFGVVGKPVVNENAPASSFTQIDIRKVTNIPVASKKAELVTDHPAESYEFKKDANGKIDYLVIKNPQEFWRLSNYLVMVVN